MHKLYNALCQCLSRFLVIIFSIIIIVLPSTFVQAESGIISLKPNITEILFELGVGSRVIGVTTFCDYPVDAKKIPPVADYVHVDVEKVLALKPSLVIGSEENSVKKEIEFLRRNRINVHVFPFVRLEDTFASMKQIAKLVGVEEKGREMVAKIQTDLERLKSPPGILGYPRILLIVGTRPLVVVGGKNLLDDLLQLMGGVNIAGQSRLSYPNFSTEQFIAAQPEIIIDLTMGNEKKDEDQRRRWYEQFKSVPAVANNRIYFMDVADFRASPRMVVGARKLADVFD